MPKSELTHPGRHRVIRAQQARLGALYQGLDQYRPSATEKDRRFHEQRIKYSTGIYYKQDIAD